MLQEESGTLQSLQRDKEDIERALGGLRKRLHDGRGPPLALEAARKQQHTLERELSRVHQLLAENSKVDKVPSRQVGYSIFVLHIDACTKIHSFWISLYGGYKSSSCMGEYSIGFRRRDQNQIVCSGEGGGGKTK